MSTIFEKKNLKLAGGTEYTARVESYSSAKEAVHDLKNRQPRYADYDMTNHPMRTTFHGVNNYGEALDLLENGYQPTVEKLEQALKPNKMGSGKRTSFRNDICGFQPIIPLALKGVPNSMLNSYTKPIKCKVVDIYYDMGINGGIKADTIIEAGQKLLGAIIELEQQGYRFNIYALQAYSGFSNTDIFCVKIKSSDKPLDLKRMSFPLTHPAFFRVIGFDWQGRSPIAEYRGSGRGRALTDCIDVEEAKELIKECFGKNALYFSCNEIKKHSEQAIKEVLTK